MNEAARRTTMAILSILSVSGCTPSRPTDLAADVDRYLRAMQAWASAEVETNAAIKRVLETQFVDDAEVRRQLAESRIRIRRHLHEAEAYRPDTADVRSVHREYVHAWTELLAGYSDVERGLDSVDARALARGREALLHWRRSLQTVATDLRDLVAISGVAPQKREGPA